MLRGLVPLMAAGTGAVVGLMVLGWFVSVRMNNAGIVERMWGLSVAVIGWVYVLLDPQPNVRGPLAAALASVWGLRLAVHLHVRDRGRAESWRYADLRRRSPRFELTTLGTLYIPQALAVVGVSLPLLAAIGIGRARGLGALDAAGCLLWTLGFGVEAVADAQLARFRSRLGRGPALLDEGLWRYSRHPNYFGDAVMWWGIGLIGLAAGAWWCLFGPLAMTIVLVRFSGASAMDRHLAATRGGAYVDYARRTSSFVPLPRKRQASGDSGRVTI